MNYLPAHSSVSFIANLRAKSVLLASFFASARQPERIRSDEGLTSQFRERARMSQAAK
jgi:hypothetical protein